MLEYIINSESSSGLVPRYIIIVGGFTQHIVPLGACSYDFNQSLSDHEEGLVLHHFLLFKSYIVVLQCHMDLVWEVFDSEEQVGHLRYFVLLVNSFLTEPVCIP